MLALTVCRHGSRPRLIGPFPPVGPYIRYTLRDLDDRSWLFEGGTYLLNKGHYLPVWAERCKASVCGRSLVGTAGSNPAGGMDVSVASVVCCQVEVSATGRSLVQRVLPTVVCQCV